jgi:hypothetical protein
VYRKRDKKKTSGKIRIFVIIGETVSNTKELTIKRIMKNCPIKDR